MHVRPASFGRDASHEARTIPGAIVPSFCSIKRLDGSRSKTRIRMSTKSDAAAAVKYALCHWQALVRFCNDGCLEIDNNAAERSLQAIALGRKITCLRD